ncbi:MAG: hypothetical protein KY475_14910 [Planctomycetes bacterium]|nr:hypothetical protein [Planctomycetota bacterium]
MNVDQSKAAHSLGIASLVLGVLAFFVCWMPFIGLGFGGLGLLLGVGGLVLAITRKGSGIGFSIAGTAVSSVATVVGIVFMTGLFGMFSAIDEAANRPPTVATPVGVASADDNGGEELAAASPPAGASGEPGEAPSDASSAVPPPAEAKEPAWPIADQAQQLGNVQVAITSVTIGNVPVRQVFLDSDTESEKELLLIRLTVTNISERKKIDYRGWMSSYASLLDVDAELTDDVDNRYRMVNFGSTATIKDTETNTSLYPGKSINDAVVFELPIEGVEYLRLKLAAKGCGEEGEFRFQIPPAMIQQR